MLRPAGGLNLSVYWRAWRGSNPGSEHTATEALLVSLIKNKSHHHLRFFRGRLILPSHDSLCEGICEHRMASNDLDILDGSVASNRGFYLGNSLYAHSLCDFWIFRGRANLEPTGFSASARRGRV